MTFEIQAILMAAAVFISAGLVYSFAGYKAKLYKFAKGDPSVKFSMKRISRKILMGVLLGMLAYVGTDLINGEETVDISTPEDFATQVGISLAAIYLVDKTMIAGAGGTKVSARSAAANGIGDIPSMEAIPTDDVDYEQIVTDMESPPELDSAPPDKDTSTGVVKE